MDEAKKVGEKYFNTWWTFFLLLFKIEVTVSLDVSLEISEILFLFSVFFTLECRKEFV